MQISASFTLSIVYILGIQVSNLIAPTVARTDAALTICLLYEEVETLMLVAFHTHPGLGIKPAGFGAQGATSTN